MSHEWTEVGRATTDAMPFRARCVSDPSCYLAKAPVLRATRQTADYLAQSHAENAGHETVIEERTANA